MHKKLALFPMTRDMCAVARYASLLVGYEICSLFAPPYANYEGEDICTIDGGDATGVFLSVYSDEALTNCDILFVDYDEKVKNMTFYTDVIDKAKKLNKSVIMSQKLEYKLNTARMLRPNGEPTKILSEFDRLYDVKVPVITVLSQGVRTDQFVVELALREHFINNGYYVSQIGSYRASEFFGFASLPGFLYEARDAYEKIHMFNHYVQELLQNDKPQLLIIGVPDAIMKFNDRILLGMGLIPYVVCNAVKSDLSILSMYYGRHKERYFDEMSKYGHYCYNTPLEFFNISNTHFAPDFSSELPIEKYMDINSEFAMGTVNDIDAGDFVLFNALNKASMKNACNLINDALTNNVRSI